MSLLNYREVYCMIKEYFGNEAIVVFLRVYHV